MCCKWVEILEDELFLAGSGQTRSRRALPDEISELLAKSGRGLRYTFYQIEPIFRLDVLPQKSEPHAVPCLVL